MRTLTKTLIIGSLCSSLVAGCSLQPKPEPNEVLIKLRNEAIADATGLRTTHPEIADMRDAQAKELESEASRECGHFKDGKTPDSCVIPEPIYDAVGGDYAIVLGNSASSIESELGNLPSEALPIIAVQHTKIVQSAGVAPKLEKITFTKAEDIAAAKDMLASEHSAIFALQVALAYAGDSFNAVESAIDGHRKVVEVLEESLRASDSKLVGDIPVSEAGYTFDTPRSEAAVKQFAQQQEWDDVQQYQARVISAKTTEWKKLALALAGAAGVRAQAF